MKILICAKNDLAANLACNHLCRGLDDAEITIWLSDLTRPGELENPNLGTMRFFERDLPNRWIFPLLASGPPRPAGAFLTYPELARQHGAALRILPSLHDPEVAPVMAEMDLVISIRFSHLFPQALIELPRHGILNVHPGTLPRYAGLYAPLQQILDGQEEIGCTVHWIDSGIDTGPILSHSGLPIDPGRSLLWHVCNIYSRGIDDSLGIIRAVADGRRPPGEPQDTSLRRYHHLPGVDEFQALRDKGFQLVAYADYEALLEQYRAEPGACLAARPPD